MPVRAFIDSDISSGEPGQQTETKVLMPVRAFIDSDFWYNSSANVFHK